MLKPSQALGMGVLSAFLAVVACEQPPKASREPASGHAVQSARLRRVMAGLKEQVNKTWPQGLADAKAADERRDRRRRLQEATVLAAELAKSAKRIPESVADAKMTEDQRKAFLGQAQKLEDQADALAKAAAAKDTDGMETILQNIKTTCTGCHEQFGALTGPIRFGRGG